MNRLDAEVCSCVLDDKGGGMFCFCGERKISGSVGRGQKCSGSCNDKRIIIIIVVVFVVAATVVAVVFIVVLVFVFVWLSRVCFFK